MTKIAPAQRSLSGTAQIAGVSEGLSGSVTVTPIDEIGFNTGLFVGEAVTFALKILPKWSAPVVDADGEEVTSVPGVERIGAKPIEERHKEVVGPMIRDFAAQLSDGWFKDAVDAFGRGASQAPGETYRLEAATSPTR